MLANPLMGKMRRLTRDSAVLALAMGEKRVGAVVR